MHTVKFEPEKNSLKCLTIGISDSAFLLDWDIHRL